MSALLLLQAKGRMTARQLADELDVSVRTIYRDMESLGAAGIPLYGEAGHDGGYELLAGYRTRLTGLTGHEAEALFLSGLPGAAADLGLGAVLATAQLKLLAALPDELRDRAGLLQQRFHLDTSNWYAEQDSTPHLAAVVHAVWNQRRIRVTYERWAEPREVDRHLDPLGVVLKAGRWYLVARGGDQVRTYRISQIRRLATADERFDRPADFDLAVHWTTYLQEFDARRREGEATVRMSPAVYARLPHLLEPAVVRHAEASARQAEPGGWFEVVIPIESLGHATEVLLRLGAEAEVLEPAALRDRLTETVATLARTYGVTP